MSVPECCLEIGKPFPRLDHIIQDHQEYLHGLPPLKRNNKWIFGPKAETGELITPYQCPFCEEHFDSHQLFTDHQEEDHEQGRNKYRYMCGLCGLLKKGGKGIGMARTALTNHLVMDHGLHNIGYPCPLKGCDCYFGELTKLDPHLKQKREGHNIPEKEKRDELREESKEEAYPEMVGLTSTKVTRNWAKNTCPCGESFEHLHYLQRHRSQCAIALKELPYETIFAFSCSRCKKPFAVDGDRKDHELSCFNIQRECSICHKMISARNRTHEKVFHFGKADIPCSTCGRMFKVKSYLKRHQASHSNKKPWKCKVLVDPKTNKPTSDLSIAVECPKRYKTCGDLYKHRSQTHYRKYLMCPKGCGYPAPTKGKLTGHLKDVHGSKDFECDICEYATTTNLRLQRHKKWHQPPQYSCEECGELFYEKKSLKDHDDIVHKGVYKHVCESCGKRFASAVSLYNHNTGFRDSICADLDVKGASLGEKVIHRVLTDMEVPYSSEVSFPRAIVEGKPSKGFFRYDFQVRFEDFTLWIEYDGAFHFKPHTLHPKEERNDLFVDRVQRDLLKSRYIHGLKDNMLVRITGDNVEGKLLSILFALDCERQLTWMSGEDERNLEWYFSVSTYPKIESVTLPIAWNQRSSLAHFNVFDQQALCSDDSLLREILSSHLTKRTDFVLAHEHLVYLAKHLKYQPSMENLGPLKHALLIIYLRQAKEKTTKMLSEDLCMVLLSIWRTMPESKLFSLSLPKESKKRPSIEPMIEEDKREKRVKLEFSLKLPTQKEME